jgi:hypothetical protein
MSVILEINLEPTKVRSLVLQLESKDQLAIIAAITNNNSKDRFSQYSPSDIRTLRGYLQGILTETEEYL